MVGQNPRAAPSTSPAGDGPALRRFVMWRDRHACTVEGCSSTYRLETHHITGIGRAWAASDRDESAAVLLAFADSNLNPYREYATPVLEELGAGLGPTRMDIARAEASELDLGAAARLARTIG